MYVVASREHSNIQKYIYASTARKNRLTNIRSSTHTEPHSADSSLSSTGAGVHREILTEHGSTYYMYVPVVVGLLAIGSKK